MRCGSICSISMHCKNESIYFHIQMAPCVHLRNHRLTWTACYYPGDRTPATNLPINHSHCHTGQESEKLWRRRKGAWKRENEKNRASNMGTYIIFKDLLIVGIRLRWSDHKSIVKFSTFCVCMCWEITSWLVLSDRGKEWLRVSRWARDCCMWVRAESKLEAELALLSSLPFFLLFSLMPFRAFCARFVISSLASTESLTHTENTQK